MLQKFCVSLKISWEPCSLVPGEYSTLILIFQNFWLNPNFGIFQIFLQSICWFPNLKSGCLQTQIICIEGFRQFYLQGKKLQQQDLSLICLASKGFFPCLQRKPPSPKHILCPKKFLGPKTLVKFAVPWWLAEVEGLADQRWPTVQTYWNRVNCSPSVTYSPKETFLQKYLFHLQNAYSYE